MNFLVTRYLLQRQESTSCGMMLAEYYDHIFLDLPVFYDIFFLW